MDRSDLLSVVGLCGSLRAASFNRGLLLAAVELSADRARVVIPDLTGLPEFNEDLEAEPPARVGELKQIVDHADILLFAVPEYNYSLPGWFKNVLDWLSRPAATTPLRRKPAGLITASAGERGGARAQLALRSTLVYTDTYVMNRPEMFVGRATSKFSSSGRLEDEATRTELQRYLDALRDWASLVSVSRQ